VIRGADIIAARKRAGLTQAELAERIGARQNTVWGWERDGRQPHKRFWPALARLGVPIAAEEAADPPNA
jgi:transcriptional regulator with XRE-family HTH domain